MPVLSETFSTDKKFNLVNVEEMIKLEYHCHAI